MNKLEWYDKIVEWSKEDGELRKLPYYFFWPLADKLAQHDTAQVIRDSSGVVTCAVCGTGLDVYPLES